MKLGSVNEDLVVDAIDPYMSKYGYTLVNEPFEAGLVARETKPWLAASVDGFVSFGTNGAIEIKTMCRKDTVARQNTRSIEAWSSSIWLCGGSWSRSWSSPSGEVHPAVYRSCLE